MSFLPFVMFTKSNIFVFVKKVRTQCEGLFASIGFFTTSYFLSLQLEGVTILHQWGGGKEDDGRDLFIIIISWIYYIRLFKLLGYIVFGLLVTGRSWIIVFFCFFFHHCILKAWQYQHRGTRSRESESERKIPPFPRLRRHPLHPRTIHRLGNQPPIHSISGKARKRKHSTVLTGPSSSLHPQTPPAVTPPSTSTSEPTTQPLTRPSFLVTLLQDKRRLHPLYPYRTRGRLWRRKGRTHSKYYPFYDYCQYC